MPAGTSRQPDIFLSFSLFVLGRPECLLSGWPIRLCRARFGGPGRAGSIARLKSGPAPLAAGRAAAHRRGGALLSEPLFFSLFDRRSLASRRAPRARFMSPPYGLGGDRHPAYFSSRRLGERRITARGAADTRACRAGTLLLNVALARRPISFPPADKCAAMSLPTSTRTARFGPDVRHLAPRHSLNCRKLKT